MGAVDRLSSKVAKGRGHPLSRVLLDSGGVTPKAMLGAMAEAGRLDRPLAEVVAAEALVTPAELLDAQALQFRVQKLNLDANPPDPQCIGLLPAEFCLQQGLIPWMRIGPLLVIATSRPEAFSDLTLPDDIGPVTMAVATEEDIHLAIQDRFGAALVRRAETLRPARDSCRDLNRSSTWGRIAAGSLALLGLTLLALAPLVFFAAALALACCSLLVSQGLKLAALVASLRAPNDAAEDIIVPSPDRLPRVSLLVPLLREADIAGTLLKRLERLEYPRSLLEVALILEEDDNQTREILSHTRLPPWARVITVPKGSVQTKPRALNYALPFTRGEVVGIYDAEDAPARDQLLRVVGQFSRAPPQVACLQGILDFYNPRANWLSRCFAIEYASWFRLLLPGMVRLGLPIPLGGTTVFFRRSALEQAQGWDAHNVTEDADLGIRLARLGYVTELLPSATREEANNRIWPWIRQRSRWLKGYALTWWVHSRRPARLWQDLGTRRFLGMQALFLGTLLQFAMAPVLWSFWLIVFGLPHPLDGLIGSAAQNALIAVFLSAEAVSLLVGLTAVSRSPHTGLMVWVPSLVAYFPLGTLAIYKGLWETLSNPFYWDKTDHGHCGPDGPGMDQSETNPVGRVKAVFGTPPSGA